MIYHPLTVALRSGFLGQILILSIVSHTAAGLLEVAMSLTLLLAARKRTRSCKRSRNNRKKHLHLFLTLNSVFVSGS